jgi:predicted MPP superfamily phosphohydrolase
MTHRIIALFLIILFTDILLYVVLNRVFANVFYNKTFKWGHLAISALFIVFTLIIVAVTGNPGENYLLYRNYYLWMDLFLVIYLPKLTLLLTLSPLLLFRFGRRPGRIKKSSHLIELRRKYIWLGAAFFITLLMLFITFDGLIRGSTRFTVKKVDLSFKNLPPGFDGFTIAQFSDVHLGSWSDKNNISKALKTLQDQNADIIVFTGDIVNINASETRGYEKDFKALSALGGKFAVFGNHDFGDFVRIDKGKNIGKEIPMITQFFVDQQFRVLRNAYQVIHKQNDSILIAGVDNWSKSHYSKFGDLDKTFAGQKTLPFTILLSHDPSHWDAEILQKCTAELTLSGHTHGGQLGFRLFNLMWSPIQYRYPEWNGLYHKDGRYLYVNPGIGFVGYSGRIGILPEITLICLHKQT